MIDRPNVRVQLYQNLQTHYVALLGQRGIGVRTTIQSLVKSHSDYHDMKFVSIFLPLDMPDEADFKQIFLEHLIETAKYIPPIGDVARQIGQDQLESSSRSVDFRLRRALDTLGRLTSARYLVLVLHALNRVSEMPLRNLLLLLREYHDQMHYPGSPGEKLRILVAGDERLWHLCYHYTDSALSPFNIAQRFFLPGLSDAEVANVLPSNYPVSAHEVNDFIGGIPQLVERITNNAVAHADPSALFHDLHPYWESLRQPTKESLKQVISGSVVSPRCFPDYQCAEIPDVNLPWSDAFWGGFLRLQGEHLTWRTPIHQAFAQRFVAEDRSVQTMNATLDLQTRLHELERDLRKGQLNDEVYFRTGSLASAVQDVEWASIINLARNGDSQQDIQQALLDLTSVDHPKWLQAFSRLVLERMGELNRLLVAGAILTCKHSLRQFDIFMCHNGSDKPLVKSIGERLMIWGILPWLDEWELPPGQPWQRLIQAQIPICKSAAIFVGATGIGPWQTEEMEAFLSQFVTRKCPVIPVFLPNYLGQPEMPPFLGNRTWVDFRRPEPDPLGELLWGIAASNAEQPGSLQT